MRTADSLIDDLIVSARISGAFILESNYSSESCRQLAIIDLTAHIAASGEVIKALFECSATKMIELQAAIIALRAQADVLAEHTNENFSESAAFIIGMPTFE